ncbi:MAG: MBL fold metallo-hydrolase [Nitrososphaerota archaeon]
MLKHGLYEITYLEHDTFRVKAKDVIIYTDPFKIKTQNIKADIVTISHDHFDHMSAEDLKKVLKPETIIIASTNCSDDLAGISASEKIFLKPGERVKRLGVEFEAVYAYNVNKFRAPGQPFHPKDYLGVGFVIDTNGERIYHAGDTDNILEMAGLKDIGIAMLPVSGTYVMTAEEAAQAAQSFKPRLAVPMHYGAIVGTEEDAKRFSKLTVSSIKAEVMKKEQ